MLPLYRDKSLYSSFLQVWPAVYTHASMYSGIYLASSGPAVSPHHIPHVLCIPRSAASTTFQSYKLVTRSRDRKTSVGSFTTSFTHRTERIYFMDAFLCWLQVCYSTRILWHHINYRGRVLSANIWQDNFSRRVFHNPFFQLPSLNDALRNAEKISVKLPQNFIQDCSIETCGGVYIYSTHS